MNYLIAIVGDDLDVNITRPYYHVVAQVVNNILINCMLTGFSFKLFLRLI